MFRQKLKTSQYLAEMIVASTVVPNLYNKELQESYEVKTPVDLLYALVDDPATSASAVPEPEPVP